MFVSFLVFSFSALFHSQLYHRYYTLQTRYWKLRVINTFSCHSPCCLGSEDGSNGRVRK